MKASDFDVLVGEFLDVGEPGSLCYRVDDVLHVPTFVAEGVYGECEFEGDDEYSSGVDEVPRLLLGLFPFFAGRPLASFYVGPPQCIDEQRRPIEDRIV